MRGTRAFVVGLLGAESTGKTTLSVAMAETLARDGRSAVVVPEVLREFCDRHARTPRHDEQRGIADEQTRRIAAAALDHDLVIADTTALMIAVYSDQVFGDTGLYPDALADHSRCDLTLLMALDLPWQADGLQRDGPHVREPVDARLRSALDRAGIDYSIVVGDAGTRVEAALACARRALEPGAADGAATAARWHWNCDRCGDAQCERHWLPPTS